MAINWRIYFTKRTPDIIIRLLKRPDIDLIQVLALTGRPCQIPDSSLTVLTALYEFRITKESLDVVWVIRYDPWYEYTSLGPRGKSQNALGISIGVSLYYWTRKDLRYYCNTVLFQGDFVGSKVSSLLINLAKDYWKLYKSLKL